MSHFQGDYWIDPNEGDIRDAILVRCDAEKRSTCIFASPTRTREISHVGNEIEVWLNDIGNVPKVNYRLEKNYKQKIILN